MKEFREIYKKQFGVDIEDAEADLLAEPLLNVYKLIYGQDRMSHNAPEPNGTGETKN